MGKTWKQVGPGELLGALERLLVALGNDTGAFVERANRSSSYILTIAEFVRNLPPDDGTGKSWMKMSSNPQWLRAREIMGKNFFGVEDAVKHFGVNPSMRQLGELIEIPFEEAELERCKDTHILIAVFPLTICALRMQFHSLFQSQNWDKNENFAHTRESVGWCLVRKTPVEHSRNNMFYVQQELLEKGEYIPTARVLLYTMIGYFKMTGERLFKSVIVRCADLDSRQHRVQILDGTGDKIGIYSDPDTDSQPNLAVTSARSSQL